MPLGAPSPHPTSDPGSAPEVVEEIGFRDDIEVAAGADRDAFGLGDGFGKAARAPAQRQHADGRAIRRIFHQHRRHVTKQQQIAGRLVQRHRGQVEGEIVTRLVEQGFDGESLRGL